MSKTILRYQSVPKVYAINSSDTSYCGVINDFSIAEEFVLSDEFNGISPALGHYHLYIESEVNDSTEIQTKFFEIKKIIQELDYSWMYVCGHPLNKEVLSFMGPYIESPDDSINGWSSNYREAEKEVSKGKHHIVFSRLKTVSYSKLSYWPLKKVLAVREACATAQDNIVALIELHLFAHKVEDSYSSFFFLAKAMEIVQALLPGSSNDQKQRELPVEIASQLKTSLHYIMGLANTRYEMRHVVKQKLDCSLHDKMDNTEIVSYKHDADLLIRHVVCQNLAIPLVIPQRG